MHWLMHKGRVMGLNERYEEFCQSELKKQHFSEIVLNNRPRHRMAAIIHTAGENIPNGGSLIINNPNISSIKKRLLLLLGRFERLHNLYAPLLSGGVQLMAKKPVT